MYTHILFDLDGTILDSFEGVSNCVRYSLEKMNKNTDIEYIRFLGPPLKDSYMKHCFMSEEEAERAVEFYRERYSKIGLFEGSIYDGIRELLQKLSKKYTLILATSKPYEFAKILLNHYDISKYFTDVIGASFDDKLSEKVDIIRFTLEKLGGDKSGYLMVGDRLLDTEGAVLNGIDAVGVLYGYGDKSEHEKAVFTADSVKDLALFLGV